MNRRDFLALAGASAGLTLPAGVRALDRGPDAWARILGRAQEQRYPLARLQNVPGDGLRLVAQPAAVDIGLGTTEAWTLNGSLPAPTIRLRSGGTARIDLENGLDEPTILHWHGLTVPEAADGHPRLAIDPGSSYAYDFTVRERAGTYWYHPHTHQRTGEQTYMGMAGLLIVEDDEEQGLELPSGEYDVPLILQDKRLGDSGGLRYDIAMGHDVMMGYLGDTGFGNGVANPTLSVRRGRYRFRILNASNARIFELGLDDDEPFTLIGTDGGLLETPVPLSRVMLGTGERADVLVDFSGRRPGDRIMIRSFAFDVPGMMGGGMMGGRAMGRGRGRGGGMMAMMGERMQGTEMDLLELVVEESDADSPRPLPERLSRIAPMEVDADTPRRTFQFSSMMMSHTINGRSFELDRVDERVPIGRTEIWSLVNDSQLAHPIHVHVGQFRVLAREGGRNRVMPWETGLKDTVLAYPGERVDIGVRFDEYTGVFLLHCHNLEHEDNGMMMNFEVVG